MITDLVPGQILLIDNYELRNYGGPDKLRWFIYLGRMLPEFDNEDTHYFCTTTTLHDAKKIAAKEYFEFKPPPFTQDCYVYFRESLHEMSATYLEKKASDGEIDLSKGRITESQVKFLYLGYWNLELIAPIILRKIKATIIRKEVLDTTDLPDAKTRNKKRY